MNVCSPVEHDHDKYAAYTLMAIERIS
ncbi:hypothetical protein PBCVNEJV1_827R [Paramecium bursaria Chlorella virus NE-JV-1]|nr:hypothetical protein PBCVNEJV1_827R [Paramecium bursaria Chlorella virus NE-JV-1]